LGRSRAGVGVDGRADGVAPAVAAKGAAVFVSCKVDALDHDLSEVGQGARGLGRNVAADGGGEEFSKSRVEIAGREIFAGEEVSELASEGFGRIGAVLAASVKRTEQRMAGLTQSAAAAAVGESESTQGCGTDIRHGSLLRVGIGKSKIENRKSKYEKTMTGNWRPKSKNSSAGAPSKADWLRSFRPQKTRPSE